MTAGAIQTPPETILSFSEGSPEWKALRKKALANLFWFDAVVLNYGSKFPMEEDTHLVPLTVAQRRTGNPLIDEAPMQMHLWPRMSGKSTCITRGLATQEICRDPEISILIANEKAEVAEGFLADIKGQFENNELLRHLFPEVIPPDFNKTTWSNEKIIVNRQNTRPEATIETIGVGGTKTGRHYDRIICDDLISQEAAENARSGSWLIMERVNRWVTRLKPLRSKYQPFPWMLFIGTRWFHDDTYDYIREVFGHGEEPRRFQVRARTSTGKVVSREVERVGEIVVMRIPGIEDGKSVFPKIYTLEELANMRQENPEDFACLIQNDPSEEAVVTFSESWLKYWVNLDGAVCMYEKDAGGKQYTPMKDLSKVMIVDPAFSSSGSGARSAVVVVGTDLSTGKRLVLDVLAQRTEPRDLVADILNMAAYWKPTRLYIEAVAQQKGFIQFVESEARARNLHIAIEEVKPGGRAKDVRIEGLGVYFKSGDLLVHASQIDLLDEYRKYRPGSRLVDVLDALAYAPEVWPRVSARNTGQTGDARERVKRQLESYRERRKRGRR